MSSGEPSCRMSLKFQESLMYYYLDVLILRIATIQSGGDWVWGNQLNSESNSLVSDWKYNWSRPTLFLQNGETQCENIFSPKITYCCLTVFKYRFLEFSIEFNSVHSVVNYRLLHGHTIHVNWHFYYTFTGQRIKLAMFK